MTSIPTDSSANGNEHPNSVAHAPVASYAKPKLGVSDLLIPFIVPTLIGKCFILYFGLNYSENPGEGYGIGLVVAISFTILMIGKFLWRYRHYEEELPPE